MIRTRRRTERRIRKTRTKKNLCDNFQIRLTDCALAKEEFFPEDYENLNSEESHLGSCVSPTEDVFVPLRWMAIETLTEYTQTSTSSDVWSLGIFLWEISSQGEHPYSCISPSHLLSFLREEHRLRQPPTCPDELFRLMNACWSAKPQQRPSALEVNEFLQ
ncbi:Tyrosine-protein kinase RYK, partial [Armadillidium nasatum]